MKKVIGIGILAFALSGCGMIDNSVRSDESIKEKAAFALGTTADKITITNKRSEMDSVKFNATFNKRIYQCYYTSTFGFSSDALCSPTDGGAPSKTAQCNDLLKASGKCN